MIIEQLRIEPTSALNYQGKFDELDELLILCFFQKNYTQNQELIDQLQKKFPKAIVTGCSGAGEVVGDEILDNILVVNILKFKRAGQFEILSENILPTNSLEVGMSLGLKLSEIKNVKGAIILSDGLIMDGEVFSKGIKSKLSINIPIIGGLAGDGVDFKETSVVLDGKISTGKIVVIALKDHLSLAVSANGGWNRFGFEHTITKSSNNIVYEIDHRPALDFYKEYLGKEAANLPASGLHFPLNILKSDDSGSGSDDVVRTLLAIDEENKSLTFAGSIAQNSKVDLMKSTTKNLLASSEDNLANIKDRIPEDSSKIEGDLFSLIISCVGRRLALGQKSDEELGNFRELSSDKIFQSGFYSYGEMSPTNSSKCSLHNQTLTQAILWEEADE